MRRYSQRTGHTAMAELNVTPLLDLAFVLLIIFIITTPLMENNIPMQLPSGSEHAGSAPDPKSIRTVSVDAHGQIFLESQPIELPALEKELEAFKRDTPDAAVVVKADKSLRYQQVVDVMDVLEKAQISKLSLVNVAP